MKTREPIKTKYDMRDYVMEVTKYREQLWGSVEQ